MRLFSTKQITKYHPDKLADQISDAVVDACIAQDSNARVACECMVKGETVILAGEITTTAKVNYAEIASRVCRKLGYKVSNILTYIENQSPEIASGVGEGDDQGAGDQGMMYGFAADESPMLLPFGFYLANRLTKKIEDFVESNDRAILLGDAKVQVTVDLDADPNLASVHKILVSACHNAKCDFEFVKSTIMRLISEVVNEVAEEGDIMPRRNLEITINPAGEWTIGGPVADCGLTGRKIVCDQYGGYCAVGGGAFSGKDPSKVDRSGAYMARKIACDLLSEFRCDFVQVQIAYAIGQAKPMSVCIMTPFPDLNKQLEAIVAERYDLTPSGIIKTLDLKRPIYEHLAEGCHYREV